ncbi:MAG: tryptophan synthase subunit alpha [Dehalococcoidia bacterium]|nr:tryptophan synthase subunit alpha [Dehalococcoidia bacterium]
MSRLVAAFDRARGQGRLALIPFLTVGYPDVSATPDLVSAVVAGGADIVELGVPFSDPLADGATIQKASAAALGQGVTLLTCLETAGTLRRRGVDAPLVLMGYYNPFLAYGLERFARDAARQGVDGVIVADLPPEEAEPFHGLCRAQGLDMVFLLSPTSTDARVRRVCRLASGFIYCVSLTGVTGARQEMSSAVADLIRRIRGHTTLPLAVGFGISTPEHVRAVAGLADGAIVGSALLDAIGGAAPAERAAAARAFVAHLASAARIARP